ncbi:TAR DNA-binding protein 43 [Clonorchis sinensis]|uniref:TAR DNA-binding protein 43 n=1 Tax=Clonorchis sinensis TaxID=79923 RepID=G7YLW9_CLOSI|nr:TAR DNA-binding protein 43 [Clonorchis sinensis]
MSGVQYIRVSEDEDESPIEVPMEADGTVLLTTLNSVFPKATGLKYLAPDSGCFRGVRLNEADKKRKVEEDQDSQSAKSKKVEGRKCTDLIVLNLAWKTDETTLREYFSKYGELVMVQAADPMDQRRPYSYDMDAQVRRWFGHATMARGFSDELIALHCSTGGGSVEEDRFRLRASGDAETAAAGYAGVGIVLSERAEASLLDWIPVDSRLCAVRLAASLRAPKIERSRLITTPATASDNDSKQEQPEKKTESPYYEESYYEAVCPLQSNCECRQPESQYLWRPRCNSPPTMS